MQLIQRTLTECRERTWYAPAQGVTEQFIRGRGGPPTTRDFLGIIDLVVFPALQYSLGNACLGLQVTSSSNHAARVKKAMANEHLIYWLKSGNHFQVWSWRQKGSCWILREQALMLIAANTEIWPGHPVTREIESQSEPPGAG